ncbi:Tubulin gamma chain [Aphelenchoides besseyi]|nr:Tubulin gamma chain [Aphelenchoides besseyi]
MSSQIITLQIGQCGNQLGAQFWNGLCQEHGIGENGFPLVEEIRGKDNKEVFFDQADNGRYIPRAVLIDLEPRVINTITRSGYGELYNDENIFQSGNGGGAGNQWTQGYERGAHFGEDIMRIIQHEAEGADNLEGFIVSHSVNGGTGSGLGSRVLEMLRDEFPKQVVQTYSVFPTSQNHDVVVGPYNTGLALRRLIEFADNVVVVDNVALNRLASELSENVNLDHVNQMVSTILTATTAPIRFYGETYNRLDTQIAELGPFPQMHFVQPGSELSMVIRHFVCHFVEKKILKTSVQDTLSRLLKPSSMMVTAEPPKAAAVVNNHSMLAGLAILQGNLENIDIADVILRMEQKQRFTYPTWSGLTLSTTTCIASPYIKREFKVSGVLLANHTNIANVFDGLHRQFRRFRSKKSYYQQFADYADAEEELDLCETSMLDLRDLYNDATRDDFLSRDTTDKENLKPEPSDDDEVGSC